MSDLGRHESDGEPRVQRFYSARASEPSYTADEPAREEARADYDMYTPNEYAEPPLRDDAYYEPNEPDIVYDEAPYAPPVYERAYEPPRAEIPDEPPEYAARATDARSRSPYAAPVKAQFVDSAADDMAEPPARDYSAYSKGGLTIGATTAQPSYAPPQRLDLRGTIYLSMNGEQSAPQEEPPQAQVNVYRPREATWAETARRSAVAEAQTGYQVRDEEPAPAPARTRKKRHGARNAIIILSALVVLGGAGYLLRDNIEGLIKRLTGSESTPVPIYNPVTTPAPVKGYDAAPKAEVSELTRREIDEISGAVSMEAAAVTPDNVLTRSAREDGLYDFYLFSASDGRLLCYFEGLEKNGMVPVDGGRFYVKQAPYLISSDGSALLRVDSLEASLGKRLIPREMLGGWSVLADEQGKSFNYMSAEGSLMSTLWFSRAYPFTGALTAAYVDTGLEGSDERYMLYILSSDGVMEKWLEAPDMSDVVLSACAAAYLDSGELFALSDTDEPLTVTDEAVFYPDCDAIVARDKETGKYGLYVNGSKHYDFEYDSIKPVECDIVWAGRSYESGAGKAEIRVVADADYPQPLSHYFELQKDGGKEYVALSSVGVTPILLDEQP